MKLRFKKDEKEDFELDDNDIHIVKIYSVVPNQRKQDSNATSAHSEPTMNVLVSPKKPINLFVSFANKSSIFIDFWGTCHFI